MTKSLTKSIKEICTTLKDWAAMATVFSLVMIVTVGPFLFGLAIFLAFVKLVWYVLFRL